jgi:hypothetical protein
VAVLCVLLRAYQIKRLCVPGEVRDVRFDLLCLLRYTMIKLQS